MTVHGRENFTAIEDLLLLAALLARRREEGERKEGLLLLAALLARRREEGERKEDPLLLAALAARREEPEERKKESEERREEISPLVLAALMARRQEEEEIEHKRQELQAFSDKEAKDQQEISKDLEERRLRLRIEAAEFKLDFINRALDTTKKLIDVCYTSADADQEAIGARILAKLLRVSGIEQLDFILSLPQGTENKKVGEEVQ